MKKHWKLICLLFAVLLFAAGCKPAVEEPPANTNGSGSSEQTGTAGGGDLPEPPPEEGDSRSGTAVNIDPDALTYMYRYYGKDVSNLESKCTEWFNSHYADCGISDLLYNLSDAVPSKTWDSRYNRYTRKTENGKPIDYTKSEVCEASYRIYEEGDVDPYDVWFRLCRENNIHPWLSFRMNDVHYANQPTEHSAFFYEAKEKGWMIGNSRSSYWLNNSCTAGSRAWYQYALNYAIPEVRAHFVANIDEMLGKYDAYGIELDWQRTIWCFPEDSVDNCKYMDLLMEEINRVV